MGLRFRKSVKVGIFRVNFSKHGVGWSVGVPGYRKTYKATGGSRTTYSVPGTGISYSHDTSKKNNSNNSNKNNNNYNSNQTIQSDATTNIETIINDSNQNEFVSKLNEVTSFNKKRKIILIIASILGFGAFGNIGGEDTGFYILMFLASIAAIIYFFKKKKYGFRN